MLDFKYSSVVKLGQVRHLTLLYLDTLNPTTWRSSLAVDFDIGRHFSPTESTITALTCQGPFSLLEKFVAKQWENSPDNALDMVIIGILKSYSLWY